MSANSLRSAIQKKVEKRRIFYVCRDLERAIGLEKNWPNYFIITNNGDFSKKEATKNRRIILINDKRLLDTRELLVHPKTAKTISIGDYVLVFKNAPLIEKICRQKKWKLLNPSAKLSAQVEEKISQVQWLGVLKKYLPLTKIDTVKNLVWPGKKFILQYNRSHTGSGTILVDSARKLEEIKKQFPNREARASQYVNGPIFTNNNVVWDKKTLIGNINYQITGLKPFTDNPFATVGNDWSLPKQLLSSEQLKQYKKITAEVGKKLVKDGWRGLYGIDIALEKASGRLYLIEINARQPASTTYESQLQQQPRTAVNDKSATTFEAHLASLLDIDPKGYKLIEIEDGAQVIQRVTADTPRLPESKLNPHTQTNVALTVSRHGEKKTANHFHPHKWDFLGVGVNKKLDFNIIRYENEKLDSDLMRLQTQKGIMSGHNKFNQHGKQARQLVKKIFKNY